MTPWLRVRLALDRVVATVIGIAISPIIALLAMMVKRHDGGPAFLRVERVGRNAVPFGMWKLRTMRADGPDGLARGEQLTAQHDRRVTPLGGRLRDYHLDELPQLLNVARGEMLLLGPRPESPVHVEANAPEWRRVLVVPPGIAGPTQVMVGKWESRRIADDPSESGPYRSEVLPVKLAIDRWYVENASLTRDVEIVIALVNQFLPVRKMTRMRRRVEREVPVSRVATERPNGPPVIEVTA